MSLLWKLKLDGDEPGRLLFNKLSSTESECNACAKKIPTSNKGVTNLKAHLRKHPQYKEQLAEMEKADQAKKEAMQKGLQQFVIKGTVYSQHHSDEEVDEGRKDVEGLEEEDEEGGDT
uniref:BED-type domain-containing protein n=1 Tax=Ditylenchus dipsaci TaxID=166011 RepID=A0A915D4A3_9BILA